MTHYYISMTNGDKYEIPQEEYDKIIKRIGRGDVADRIMGNVGVIKTAHMVGAFEVKREGLWSEVKAFPYETDVEEDVAPPEFDEHVETQAETAGAGPSAAAVTHDVTVDEFLAKYEQFKTENPELAETRAANEFGTALGFTGQTVRMIVKGDRGISEQVGTAFRAKYPKE